MRRIDLARSGPAHGVGDHAPARRARALRPRRRRSAAPPTRASPTPCSTKAGVKKIEEARESHLADVEELFGSRFSAAGARAARRAARPAAARAHVGGVLGDEPRVRLPRRARRRARLPQDPAGARRRRRSGSTRSSMPPGYEGFRHYHDTQDELYFVHRGRDPGRRRGRVARARRGRALPRELDDAAQGLEPVRRGRGRLRRRRQGRLRRARRAHGDEASTCRAAGPRSARSRRIGRVADQGGVGRELTVRTEHARSQPPPQSAVVSRRSPGRCDEPFGSPTFSRSDTCTSLRSRPASRSGLGLRPGRVSGPRLRPFSSRSRRTRTTVLAVSAGLFMALRRIVVRCDSHRAHPCPGGLPEPCGIQGVTKSPRWQPGQLWQCAALARSYRCRSRAGPMGYSAGQASGSPGTSALRRPPPSSFELAGFLGAVLCPRAGCELGAVGTTAGG